MSAHRSTPVNLNELGDVRYWLIADVHRPKPEGPLYPPKQAFGGGVSAFERIVSA